MRVLPSASSRLRKPPLAWFQMLNAVKAKEDTEYEDAQTYRYEILVEKPQMDGGLPGLLPFHPNPLSLVPLGSSWRIAGFSIAGCGRRKPEACGGRGRNPRLLGERRGARLTFGPTMLMRGRPQQGGPANF